KTALNIAVSNFRNTQQKLQSIRTTVDKAIAHYNVSADKVDTNYIFLYIVKKSLPKGFIGLLFASIFLASWGSISAALNALTSSSLMDIHLCGRQELPTGKKQLQLGRWHTLGWGLFCIGVAMFATRMGS